MFKPVDPKVNFPELEEAISKYWKDNKIFEKSLEKESPKGDWTFLDGPPFVTGLPHYGSLLSSLPKDLFGRYYTMKGYHVRRVWGWDGHGLPIENKVENKLEIKRKKDIEDTIGVAKFIEECKKYVNEISGEWEWYVDRIGRWVDFKNAYKTWDLPYMESVMWVFKQMYDKGLVYKGLRVSLYCPHCATPISNFEVAMDADNYKEIVDASTIYKFPLENEKNIFFLAWSTTPWTKITTSALAVNPKLTYVKVKQGDAYFILAKATVKMLEGKYEIVGEFSGKELIGKKFIPHYDYYAITKGQKAFEIIFGDFVSADEGTGIVTISPYGEEDLKVMLEQNVHKEMHLDDEGNVKQDVPKFGEMYYLKTNKAVNEDLAERGFVYKDEELSHRVPLCWRCHTRLYYAPQDAWYVDVQQLKPLLIKTNESVNWFPEHFKHGRFLKSLEHAPDWNISRSRYWGSPVPVWECQKCSERFVPGSIKELEEASGQKIKELHKPEIDSVVVLCKKCGGKAYRVPEVLDSWIEAGSASFGERHYPFSPSTSSGKKQALEDFYPPDFISEYTGQIRAWFYVLHVIGGALYQSIAFKNVGVTGVILGTDGRKMSKNYGNYPDPREMLEKYGGDALRLYLMGSPVMHGEDIIISEEAYRNQVKGMILILWNVYNFFVSNANVDGWNQQTTNKKQKTKNILDQWILSLLNRLVKEETEALEKYDTVLAIELVKKFVDELSTWYIRRSRDRVGPTAENKEDKDDFYATIWEVLVSLVQLLAPITPFLAEAIYRNLTNKTSVHISDWPIVGDINDALEKQMEVVRKFVEMGHAKRSELGIKVRKPLKKFLISNSKFLISNELQQVIKDELNVKEIEFADGKGAVSVSFDTSDSPELIAEGEARDIVRKIQEERKKLGTALDEKVNVTLPAWPKYFEDEIKRKTLIADLRIGDTFSVSRYASERTSLH